LHELLSWECEAATLPEARQEGLVGLQGEREQQELRNEEVRAVRNAKSKRKIRVAFASSRSFNPSIFSLLVPLVAVVLVLAVLRRLSVGGSVEVSPLRRRHGCAEEEWEAAEQPEDPEEEDHEEGPQLRLLRSPV
jgi:hypothetical protein